MIHLLLDGRWSEQFPLLSLGVPPALSSPVKPALPAGCARWPCADSLPEGRSQWRVSQAPRQRWRCWSGILLYERSAEYTTRGVLVLVQ